MQIKIAKDTDQYKLMNHQKFIQQFFVSECNTKHKELLANKLLKSVNI